MGTRDPEEQSWADAEKREEWVSLRSEGHRSKDLEDKNEHTFLQQLFPKKVTWKLCNQESIKVKRGLFLFKERGKKTHTIV